mgnify:CR=1 FL=1
MRFYDFNRTPIVCPGCQTEFDPEAVIRSRRGRASSKDTVKEAKAAASPATGDVVDQNEDDEATAEAGAEGAGEDSEGKFVHVLEVQRKCRVLILFPVLPFWFGWR